MADIIRATHLLYSDDFTSYTSDADIVAAYPSVVAGEDTYDEQSTDWGAAFGPDGQPGIKDQVVAPARDTGAITKNGLIPNGREFRVKGRWNFAATNHILSVHAFLLVDFENADNSFDRGGSWQLNRGHSTGTLSLVVHTKSPYGNVSGNTTYLMDLAGAVPASTPKTVEIRWRQSILNETAPGVFDPSTDGRVELYLDSVRVAEFDGPVWNSDDDFNNVPYWNACEIATIGAFSTWEIWDEPPSLQIPVNNSAECCDSKGIEGAGVAAPGAGVVRDELLSGAWIGRCDGGGTVTDVPDLTDAEDWSMS